MTKLSFQWMLQFLNDYRDHFPENARVGDFGGTEKINASTVRKALKNGGITDYTMLDYDSGIDLLKPVPKKYGKFDIGLCMDLLEHVTNPFLVVENMRNALKPGAYLFVTAPNIWEEHDHPGDYWRFMPGAFKVLFDGMQELQLGYVRDQADVETVPRTRLVAIYRNP